MTTPGSIPTHLPAGVYRHYKGPLYLVLGLAHDANADVLGSEIHIGRGHEPEVWPLGERKCVVYVGLQLDAAHEGPRLAVRTLEDFFARVHLIDGSICPESKTLRCSKCLLTNATPVPRFTYLGAEFQDGMQS